MRQNGLALPRAESSIIPPRLRFGRRLHLRDLDHDELRGLQWSEAHEDVHDAAIAIVLRRCLGVTFCEVRLARRPALERSLPEQAVHERADVQADLRPERLVI